MENTQNNQSITASPSNPTQPVQSSPDQQMKKGSKTTFMVVLVLVLVLIAAIGLFIMQGGKTTKTQQPTETAPTQAVSTPTPITSQEEQEVENVDVEDKSMTEFSDVEKDIQGL